MDDKELPVDYFAPIVTISERPPPKIRKIKIKIEPNEEGEMSGEIVRPKRRGRPRKEAEPAAAVPKKKKKKSKKGRSGEESDDDDDDWSSSRRRRKKKGERASIAAPDEVEVKAEPVDPGPPPEDGIKEEIKEEPSDELCVEVPIPEELKHVSTARQEDKKFKCPLCTKDLNDTSSSTVYTQKELKQHYKQSHPGKRLRQSRFSNEVHPCDVCGKEFRSASAVKDHIETHNNYYYCDVCNASQKKILEHIVHLRVHSGSFRCLMCDFSTPDINAITDHVNNHEDSFNRYWCASCKKGFQILSWFQEHDNYHTGLKPFDCEYCGKCFLYSRYLHAHKANLHPGDVSYPALHQCCICGKQYQHKNSLKLHMNSHTGNFSVCDICGKVLSSKEKLKFHIRTHTGYKPYGCPYCDKSFTKKPILVEHVRIHTGERPYVCEYCEKAFSQRSSLVIHIRGHTGERPYVCQFCDKGFVAKAMLNIHLKSCKGVAEGRRLT